MRSFLSVRSSIASSASRSRGVARLGRSFWRKQSGAVAVFVGSPDSADAEAWQRALLYRSEAFAEDLGPGYLDVADMVCTANAASAAAR